jgi:hypothetical protein
MQNIQEEKIFSMLEREPFLKRLAREFGDLGSEAKHPVAYLKAAFSTDNPDNWLPRSFVERLVEVFKHPLQFIKTAFSFDVINLGYIYQPADAAADFTTDVAMVGKPVKRRPLKKLLVLSTIAHSVAIVYLGYLLVMAFIAPYKNVRIVNKAYRQYDDKLIAVMPAPLKLPKQSLENTLSLEEIRKRDRLRREEEERKRREEEERKRREEALKKAEEEKQAQLAKNDADGKDKVIAADPAKTDDVKKTEEKPKFGEINEAPIKDILGKVYSMVKVGFAKVDTTNMSLMLSFRIEKDGSITNIKVMKSSGNDYIDRQAKAVLWNLGESHAFAPLHVLSSNTIALDLTEKVARLSITGFAPSSDEASRLARDLNGLFTLMKAFRKNSSPDVAELLSHMKVSSTGKRVDADLTISSDRAGQLMKGKFDKPSGTP